MAEVKILKIDFKFEYAIRNKVVPLNKIFAMMQINLQVDKLENFGLAIDPLHVRVRFSVASSTICKSAPFKPVTESL